jgi:glutathione S-transferase
MGLYTLVIGEKNYSSWSMRAWLLLRHLGVPFELKDVHLYRQDSRAVVRQLGGETGLVPVLIQEGLCIWDTLAIFEYLEEIHGGVWPNDRETRARARSYSGEVHSGFNALRNAMPVNTRGRHRMAVRTPDVDVDIARIQEIWSRRGRRNGPWLFGRFSGADIMFAPVATRFRTYGVELADGAAVYCRHLLDHSLMNEWTALGAAEDSTIPILELPQAAA